VRRWLIAEGRDKFCKAIQYACRFLKYHAEQKGDKDMALKFNGLFSTVAVMQVACVMPVSCSGSSKVSMSTKNCWKY